MILSLTKLCYKKINGTNENSGNTALHYAVLKNNMKMVQLLVENGCDVDVINKYHKSPKGIAQTILSTEILEFLSNATIHASFEPA